MPRTGVITAFSSLFRSTAQRLLRGFFTNLGDWVAQKELVKVTDSASEPSATSLDQSRNRRLRSPGAPSNAAPKGPCESRIARPKLLQRPRQFPSSTTSPDVGLTGNEDQYDRYSESTAYRNTTGSFFSEK